MWVKYEKYRCCGGNNNLPYPQIETGEILKGTNIRKNVEWKTTDTKQDSCAICKVKNVT